MSDELPILDRESAFERLGGDEEIWLEIVALFVEDTPNELHALDDAVKSGNSDEVIRTIHSIKSSAANIGATLLSATAKVYEEKARKGTLEDPGAAAAKLRSEFEQLCEVLNNLGG